MGFFDDVPQRPSPAELEEAAPRTPQWWGPPDNVLGATVPVDLVLVNTGAVAVAVTDVTAYPAGVELTLSVHARVPHEVEDPFWHHHRTAGRGEVLRFGVRFADGRKVTNADFHPEGDPEEPPAGPVLSPRGGGGGPHGWHQDLWLWPLPPEGPLELVCEWPARDVPETHATVDAAPIREAAGRAVELWPDERPLGSSGWTST